MTGQDEYSIANFAALKTAIVNGEQELLKKLLGNRPMQDLEKSYLLDLARLKNESAIIKLLEDVPLKP